MEEYLTAPIPIIAGITRSELNKISKETLDYISEERETMFVNIRSENQGVDVDYNGQ